MWDRQKSHEMTGMTRRGQAELQTMLKLVKTPQRRGAELQTWHPLPQTIQNSMKFSTNFAERRNMLKWEPASPLRNNGAFKPWVKTWRFQAFRGLYQCCKCQRIYSESTVTGKYMKILSEFNLLIRGSSSQMHGSKPPGFRGWWCYWPLKVTLLRLALLGPPSGAAMLEVYLSVVASSIHTSNVKAYHIRPSTTKCEGIQLFLPRATEFLWNN